MKALRFIAAWLLLSFFLLAAVMVLPVLESITGYSATAPQDVFSHNQLAFGIAGEVVRALLLLLLLPMVSNTNKDLRGCLKIGLLTTGLVWTLWVIYGSGTFRLDHRLHFFMEETLVFFIQGLLSGLALYLVISKKLVDPAQ